MYFLRKEQLYFRQKVEAVHRGFSLIPTPCKCEYFVVLIVRLVHLHQQILSFIFMINLFPLFSLIPAGGLGPTVTGVGNLCDQIEGFLLVRSLLSATLFLTVHQLLQERVQTFNFLLASQDSRTEN